MGGVNEESTMAKAKQGTTTTNKRRKVEPVPAEFTNLSQISYSLRSRVSPAPAVQTPQT